MRGSSPPGHEDSLALSVSTVAEQAAKCGLGKATFLTAFYGDGVLVHLPLLPIVLPLFMLVRLLCPFDVRSLVIVG